MSEKPFVAAKPVAYCDKCGRKFVAFNPNCKTDPFGTKVDPRTPCGGNIADREITRERGRR